MAPRENQIFSIWKYFYKVPIPIKSNYFSSIVINEKIDKMLLLIFTTYHSHGKYTSLTLI